jgi:hypothetical protein
MTLQHGASKLEAIDEISTLVAAAAVCKYNSAEALMFQPYLWFSVCCLFLIFLGGILSMASALHAAHMALCFVLFYDRVNIGLH